MKENKKLLIFLKIKRKINKNYLIKVRAFLENQMIHQNSTMMNNVINNAK